nr:hypothetical protein [Tanacetum cinerariifolium]
MLWFGKLRSIDLQRALILCLVVLFFPHPTALFVNWKMKPLVTSWLDVIRFVGFGERFGVGGISLPDFIPLFSIIDVATGNVIGQDDIETIKNEEIFSGIQRLAKLWLSTRIYSNQKLD